MFGTLRERPSITVFWRAYSEGTGGLMGAIGRFRARWMRYLGLLSGREGGCGVMIVSGSLGLTMLGNTSLFTDVCGMTVCDNVA